MSNLSGAAPNLCRGEPACSPNGRAHDHLWGRTPRSYPFCSSFFQKLVQNLPIGISEMNCSCTIHRARDKHLKIR